MHKMVAAVGTIVVGLAGLEAEAQIGTVRVVSGLDTPMFVTHAPGDPNRLYIAERSGDIRIFDLTTNTLNPTSFLTIPPSQISTVGEGGLLGLAFDPDYASNGRFYVNVTAGSLGNTGNPFRTEIRRYTRIDENSAGTSFTPILDYLQPDNNHNGGWIGFNPVATGSSRHDLYISSGDGGGFNDNIGNFSQDTNSLLGKMLRINVAGDSGYTSPATNPFVGVAGRDEILAHGLRNPFRAGFDRLTGELYIGDVGQSAREEIDVLDPAVIDTNTGRAPIRNFGWRLREGNIQTPSVGGPEPANYVGPIYDYQRLGTPSYPNEFEGNAVTGGVVYRGPVPELQGLYIFGDYVSSRIWAFDPADPYGTIMDLTSVLAPPPGQGEIGSIVAFGEDAVGNVYIVDNGGEIFKIVPEPGTATLFGAAGLMLLRRVRRANG